jgi:putative copper export protein
MLFKLLLIAHLVGSSIWVGGHLILAVIVLPKALKQKDPSIIGSFEAVYEKIGIPALILQVISGIWLSYLYVSSILTVFNFEYVQQTLIALKLILLLLTVVIAVHARLRIIRKLKQENLTFLAWHIITITVLAVSMLVLGSGIRVGGW